MEPAGIETFIDVTPYAPLFHSLEIVPWAPQRAAAEFLARLERLERAR